MDISRSSLFDEAQEVETIKEEEQKLSKEEINNYEDDYSALIMNNSVCR